MGNEASREFDASLYSAPQPLNIMDSDSSLEDYVDDEGPPHTYFPPRTYIPPQPLVGNGKFWGLSTQNDSENIDDEDTDAADQEIEREERRAKNKQVKKDRKERKERREKRNKHIHSHEPAGPLCKKKDKKRQLELRAEAEAEKQQNVKPAKEGVSDKQVEDAAERSSSSRSVKRRRVEPENRDEAEASRNPLALARTEEPETLADCTEQDEVSDDSGSSRRSSVIREQSYASVIPPPHHEETSKKPQRKPDARLRNHQPGQQVGERPRRDLTMWPRPPPQQGTNADYTHAYRAFLVDLQEYMDVMEAEVVPADIVKEMIDSMGAYMIWSARLAQRVDEVVDAAEIGAEMMVNKVRREADYFREAVIGAP